MSGRKELWNGSRGRQAAGADSARTGTGRLHPRGLRRDPGQGLRAGEVRGPAGLGPDRLAVADDLRSGLLRGGDDPRLYEPVRPGPFRRDPASQPAPVRLHDRCRYPDQQDGPGAPQGLRPDAGAALGHLDGVLRQRRRLLPLFLRGGAWLRPDRAGGHLCAGLPPDGGGADLRHPPAPEEDQARQSHRPLTKASRPASGRRRRDERQAR
ncbi:hypothetical protein Lal_00005257 [Lupinus albus]|nr:hypothetical protein Lal_00005257 [Lupinus albus]